MLIKNTNRVDLLCAQYARFKNYHSSILFSVSALHELVLSHGVQGRFNYINTNVINIVYLLGVLKAYYKQLIYPFNFFYDKRNQT